MYIVSPYLQGFFLDYHSSAFLFASSSFIVSLPVISIVAIPHEMLLSISIFCGAFGTCLSIISNSILLSFIPVMTYLIIRSSRIVRFLLLLSFSSSSFVILWYCSTISIILCACLLRSHPAFFCSGVGFATGFSFQNLSKFFFFFSNPFSVFFFVILSCLCSKSYWL